MSASAPATATAPAARATEPPRAAWLGVLRRLRRNRDPRVPDQALPVSFMLSTLRKLIAAARVR